MGTLVESIQREQLRAGRHLEYFTLGWNLTEAAVAVGAGIFAGSIALLGFGTDSVIESLSGGILLWRLQRAQTDEKCERPAFMLCGHQFLSTVALEAATSLLRREQPEISVVGIILSVVSLIAMPLLARAKRRVAGRLESRHYMLIHDRQTFVLIYPRFCWADCFLTLSLAGGGRSERPHQWEDPVSWSCQNAPKSASSRQLSGDNW